MHQSAFIVLLLPFLLTACDGLTTSGASSDPSAPGENAPPGDRFFSDRARPDSLRPIAPDSIAVRLVNTSDNAFPRFPLWFVRRDDRGLIRDRIPIDQPSVARSDTSAWYYLPRNGRELEARWLRMTCDICSSQLLTASLDELQPAYYTIRVMDIFDAGVTHRGAGRSRPGQQRIDSLGGNRIMLRFENRNPVRADSLVVYREQTRLPPTPTEPVSIEPGETSGYMEMPGIRQWPSFRYRLGATLVQTNYRDDTPDLEVWPPGWYVIPLDSMNWRSFAFPTGVLLFEWPGT